MEDLINQKPKEEAMRCICGVEFVSKQQNKYELNGKTFVSCPCCGRTHEYYPDARGGKVGEPLSQVGSKMSPEQRANIKLGWVRRRERIALEKEQKRLKLIRNQKEKDKTSWLEKGK